MKVSKIVGDATGGKFLLRSFHRASAILLGVFLLTHIANHLTGLFGQQRHMDFMANARIIYRFWLIEPLLLALVCWQAGSGLTLLWRNRFVKRNWLGWLQHLSGLYLALFLIIHVSAVLVGRILLDLDTNFRFAAAGFHVSPFILFFAPYYFLAVFCLFAHVGCALYWNMGNASRSARRSIVIAFCLAGAVAGLLIVLSLSGQLYTVDIPAAYKATYQG